MDVARLSLLTLSLSQAQVGSKYVWNGTDWTWQQSRGLLPAVGEYRDSEGSGARGIEDGEDDHFDEETIPNPFFNYGMKHNNLATNQLELGWNNGTHGVSHT